MKGFITAMDSCWVNIIGHPTGRKIKTKKPDLVDMEKLGNLKAP
jgi:hypothetical protein